MFARVRGRAGVALTALLGCVLLAGCSDGPASSTGGIPVPPPPTSGVPTSATPTPTGTGSCAARTAGHLSPRELAGQVLMVATTSTRLDGATATALSRHLVGSVLLLGNSTAGVEGTRRVTDAVRAAAPPHGPTVMIAADQEGGLVQRLAGPGFDEIPSAQVQAGWSDRRLQAAARRWGGQLAAAGVDLDLAPVADVVPADVGAANAPVGALRRGYRADSGVVAAKVTAVVRGMAEADRATAAKHFPGLGRVRGNTDFSSGVLDRSTTRRDPSLAPFAAAIRAGVPLVMVSLATYAGIDPVQPAVFSRTVVTSMLRGDLGFRGVVISDDLGAADQVADVPPGRRVVRFLEAGGDLAVDGDPELAASMTRAVTERAEVDPAFAARLRAKVTRILTLKQSFGLFNCHR